MITLKGKSVFKGISTGRIKLFKRSEMKGSRYKVKDPSSEINRFRKAQAEGVRQLRQLYEKAKQEVGLENADIFETHIVMMEDPDYNESIKNLIRSEHINAEYAVRAIAVKYSEMFSSMDDAYMKAREADLRDISERLIRILEGMYSEKDAGADKNEKEANDAPEATYILVSDDLSPSEIVSIDKEKVLGILMQEGSESSHAAILARSLGIPTVIGLGKELKGVYNGMPVAIDGFEGRVYINPDDETLNMMRLKQIETYKRKKTLEQQKDLESITIDGKKIKILANISTSNDIDMVLSSGAEGIGLFRTEFLYMGNKGLPTEEQQFEAYKRVAERMNGKKVIIRTMDLGSDKQADSFRLDREENPAMGYRAIRICLMQPDIFKTQLRAIYRAAVYGNVSVMFPMIASVEEVLRIKEIIGEVKEELGREGIIFQDEIEIGIMIETPAAALISEDLAKEVDFFSVGTNDLTQYTLAIDRRNHRLDSFYNPHHKAVMRLIKMAAESAHREGKWIGICGELAADTSLTEEFLRIGIDELSVSPGMVLEVRSRVREIDLSVTGANENLPISEVSNYVR
ncbi:MAG: phosphoenolpyruvate--protein phosphotransferase [Acetivibrionales bacterium]|jgi:phosphotransferase system enzyme I (PtsI)